VETKQNALTNLAEKLKVNCGTVSPHPHEHWGFAPPDAENDSLQKTGG
jgi:hypothetical protein